MQRLSIQDHMEHLKTITDKEMLDWIQQGGHGVVCLVNSRAKSGRTFCANFHEQDWDEHEDVREAISIVMQREYVIKSGQPS